MIRRSKMLVVATLATVLALLTPSAASASDVWLITSLRVNGIANETYYKADVWPGVMPDWADTYLHVNNQVQGRFRVRFPDPQAGYVSAINFGITQYDPYFVGDTGVGWYVRSTYASVACYRGYADADGKGCRARTDAMVGPDQWHSLVLIRYNSTDFLLNMVVGANTYNVAYVSGIFDTTLTYASVGTEFNFDTSTIPLDYPGGFSFYHPAYASTASNWQEWPGSSGGNVNWFQHYYGWCPNPHRGDMPYLGDWRYWYAGTGGYSPTARCYQSPQF